jgi:hypothetical protein
MVNATVKGKKSAFFELELIWPEEPKAANFSAEAGFW